MNTIDTSFLLAQLRTAAAQARSMPAPEPVVESSPSVNFASLLRQSIDKVNEMQQDSSRLQEGFQMGESGVDLAQVMIAKSKASLAFEGMVQVRNKVVEAYQDVMRMQV